MKDVLGRVSCIRGSLALLAIALLLHAEALGMQFGRVAEGLGSSSGPLARLIAAVGQLRMTSCAPAFQQAGAFLFENDDANFVLQPLGPDINRWPTVAMIESRHSPAARHGAQTRLTSLIVAPGATCAGMYQQVIYWPQSCASLKASVFASFTAERPLLRDVRQSELNPGVQLYLMPAGDQGCVSVKKELIG